MKFGGRRSSLFGRGAPEGGIELLVVQNYFVAYMVMNTERKNTEINDGANGTIRRPHISDNTTTGLHYRGVSRPGGHPHGIYGSMNGVDVLTAPGCPTEIRCREG